MSKQATNFLALCKSAPISTIKQALKMQQASIVNELKAHFGVSDNDSLSARLSIGG